jgi:hypothetical protein
MYNFAYLIWALLFLPLWLIFFIARKDFRKPMILLALPFAIPGPITEFVWFLKDYWNPLIYVSKTGFIIQDMVYIFLLSGALMFLYPLLFHKSIGNTFDWKKFLYVALISLGTCIIVILLGFKSIYGLFAGQIPTAIFIWWQRPNLVKVSIFNFFYGCLLAFCVFSIMLKIYPHFVTDWWNVKNLFGSFIAGVPLEEILWLGFIGLGYGLLPEFVFVNKSNIIRKN